MELLLWAAILGTPILLGLAALRWIGVGWRDDRLAFAAWVYAAGSLCLALFVWIAAWVGVPLDTRFALPLLAAAAILLWLVPRPPEPSQSRTTPTGSGVGRLMLAASLLLVMLVTADRLTQSAARVVAETDEAAIWAAKSKMVYTAGGFNHAFRAATDPEARPFLHHADYPLLNPMLQLWVFIHRGGIVHLENRVPIQLFIPALFLLYAAALRRVVRAEVAALLVLALAGGGIARMLTLYAYADHLVALGWLMALDAWLRYRQTGEGRWWRLAMVGVTFTLWSKNEGMMLAATALLAAAVAAVVEIGRDRRGRGWRAALEANGLPTGGGDLAWCLLPLGVAAAHVAANRALGFGNDLFADDGAGSLWSLVPSQLAERTGIVAAYAARSAFASPLSISLAPLLFVVLVVLFPKRVSSDPFAVPGLSFALALAALFLVYAGSYHPVGWHLETSFNRVVYQLTPALTLWISAFAASLWPAALAVPSTRKPAVSSPATRPC
jgi:hypothetical protein